MRVPAFRGLVTRRTLLVPALIAIASAAGSQQSPLVGGGSRHDGASTTPALSLAPDPGVAPAGVTVYEWIQGHLKRLDARAVKDSAGVLVVPRACAQGSRVLVETEELVSRPFEVKSADCSGGPLKVKLFPRAELKLRLAAAGGSALPSQAVIAFAQCPASARSEAEKQFRLPVAISPAGAMTASLPAGCTDLSVLTPDFAPLSWWGLHLPAGKLTDLGAKSLQKGASLLIRALDSDDGLPLEGVHLRLVRAAQATKAIRGVLAGHGAGSTAEGVTGNRGWLRLSGLDDGGFTLIAMAKNHAVSCQNLTLEHGKQTVVDDLELGRLGSADVSVTWANSATPDDLSLTLVASARLCCHEIFGVRSTKVPPSGLVHLAGLSPGSWKFTAALIHPSGRAYTLGDTEATVVSAQNTFVDLSLSDLLYRGELLRGDEPVRAALRLDPLKPRPGDTRASTSSQDDGSFMVVLPRAGKYDVRVTARQPQIDTTVPSVSFSDPDKRVEVPLPRGRIVGTVVDGNGNPVARARVTAYLLQKVAGGKAPADVVVGHGLSAEDGSYSVEGARAGSWRVTAEHDQLASDPRIVQVPKDDDATGVTLVVRMTLTQSGTVRHADGRPAAGVYVWGNSVASDGLLSSAYATTDPNGHFEIRLKAKEGSPGDLVVCGPGIAAEPFRITLSGKKPAELSVVDTGGSLRLSFSSASASMFAGLALVRPDGAYLPAGELVGGGVAASMSDGNTVMTIRNLAPGAWDVVNIRNPAAAAAVFSGAGGALPGLAKVMLGRGATERVAISP